MNVEALLKTYSGRRGAQTFCSRDSRTCAPSPGGVHVKQIVWESGYPNPLLDLALRSEIIEAVQEEIGPDVVFYAGSVVSKFPGDIHHFHYDPENQPCPEKSATVWIALEGVHPERGNGIQLVSGTANLQSPLEDVYDRWCDPPVPETEQNKDADALSGVGDPYCKLLRQSTGTVTSCSQTQRAGLNCTAMHERFHLQEMASVLAAVRREVPEAELVCPPVSDGDFIVMPGKTVHGTAEPWADVAESSGRSLEGSVAEGGSGKKGRRQQRRRSKASRFIAQLHYGSPQCQLLLLNSWHFPPVPTESDLGGMGVQLRSDSITSGRDVSAVMGGQSQPVFESFSEQWRFAVQHLPRLYSFGLQVSGQNRSTLSSPDGGMLVLQKLNEGEKADSFRLLPPSSFPPVYSEGPTAVPSPLPTKAEPRLSHPPPGLPSASDSDSELGSSHGFGSTKKFGHVSYEEQLYMKKDVKRRRQRRGRETQETERRALNSTVIFSALSRGSLSKFRFYPPPRDDSLSPPYEYTLAHHGNILPPAYASAVKRVAVSTSLHLEGHLPHSLCSHEPTIFELCWVEAGEHARHLVRPSSSRETHRERGGAQSGSQKDNLSDREDEPSDRGQKKGEKLATSAGEGDSSLAAQVQSAFLQMPTRWHMRPGDVVWQPGTNGHTFECLEGVGLDTLLPSDRLSGLPKLQLELEVARQRWGGTRKARVSACKLHCMKILTHEGGEESKEGGGKEDSQESGTKTKGKGSKPSWVDRGGDCSEDGGHSCLSPRVGGSAAVCSGRHHIGTDVSDGSSGPCLELSQPVLSSFGRAVDPFFLAAWRNLGGRGSGKGRDEASESLTPTMSVRERECAAVPPTEFEGGGSETGAHACVSKGKGWRGVGGTFAGSGAGRQSGEKVGHESAFPWVLPPRAPAFRSVLLFQGWLPSAESNLAAKRTRETAFMRVVVSEFENSSVSRRRGCLALNQATIPLGPWEGESNEGGVPRFPQQSNQTESGSGKETPCDSVVWVVGGRFQARDLHEHQVGSGGVVEDGGSVKLNATTGLSIREFKEVNQVGGEGTQVEIVQDVILDVGDSFFAPVGSLVELQSLSDGARLLEAHFFPPGVDA
uniref:Uncharacterized protein n=1 Tax=Chromera velia CCMP2878 TaxID=1169474 RepID=A0A0G4H9N9_9ALVE|eukprot:Cvel_25437.t1-p1 / transcript=Cvel_25437.t1 / gene=Cvel_25437 / organism=Chromera_velia_CCMP2878 / gene_product=hypothetical protein / transcript_product=hypothetical protein / location=Cvel_scaffold2881:16978-20585(+) / protein_length=1104 / sequence_SO=supercontig / SO=protein_coding / is_pseudo=false